MATRVSFPALPWPAYPSGRGRCSCSQALRSWAHHQGQLHCLGQARCRALSPDCCREHARVSSPALPPLGLAHLRLPPTTGLVIVCSPGGGVQGPLSCVLQLPTLGPALLPAADSKWEGEGIFPLPMSPHGRGGRGGGMRSHLSCSLTPPPPPGG